MRSRRLVLVVALLVAVMNVNPLVVARAGEILAAAGKTDIPFTFTHGTFGLWSGGALLAVRDRFSAAPGVRVIDRDGREVLRFSLEIPGASRIKLYENSIARGSDGSMAAIGSAHTNDWSGTFLAVVSPEGQTQMTVRLSPFAPHAVTIASDGTIWVVGYDTQQLPDDRDYQQHLIRRYDKNGTLLGSFLPWSQVRTPPRTLPAAINSILVSAPGRVGWYSPSAQVYAEFALDGAVINWIKTPEHPRSAMLNVALCDDASLFVSAAVNHGPDGPASWNILTLDRQQGSWSSNPRPERWGKLFGCDGTRLATTTDSRTITWLEPAGK